jgi:hypothetical protein
MPVLHVLCAANPAQKWTEPMNSSKTRQKPSAQPKFFTPDEANATLPLVRAIVSDLVVLSRDLAERRQRVSLLLAGKGKTARDPYHEELVQTQKDMDRDILRLKEYVEELKALGVEPKSGTEGLVDFPAILDGRPVLLCWKLDEPRVGFWHDLEAGFAGRQPLRPDDGFQSQGTAESRGVFGSASPN